MIRNVILDWSGTLVDDLPAVWDATNCALRRTGLPELSLEAFRSEFSLPFTEFYRRLAPQVLLSDLEAAFHDRFRQIQTTVAELPHAREFLLFCRRHGLRTYLLSTVLRDYFDAQSAVNGFVGFFDAVYLGVRDKRTLIAEILQHHGLCQPETIFIGDMQHDIETARQGGIRACAVLTGYNRLDQLRASGPDLIVEHLGELQQILELDGFELLPPTARRSADRLPIATVGALVRNSQGQVLLVRTRKWSGLWGIPGGKIKRGEPAEAALRREIVEETGLALGQVELVMVQDCIDSPEFYRPAHFVLLNYVGECAGSPGVTLNDEAQEHCWVGLDQALALPLNQPTRRLIQEVGQRAAGGGGLTGRDRPA